MSERPPNYHAVSCPFCGVASGEPCRDGRGKYPSGVHTSRITTSGEDLLPHVSMRCELGEHHLCLFANSGCPCSCHRTTKNWNPVTSTPGCDWCGECEWCDDPHRSAGA